MRDRILSTGRTDVRNKTPVEGAEGWRSDFEQLKEENAQQREEITRLRAGMDQKTAVIDQKTAENDQLVNEISTLRKRLERKGGEDTG